MARAGLELAERVRHRTDHDVTGFAARRVEPFADAVRAMTERVAEQRDSDMPRSSTRFAHARTLR